MKNKKVAASFTIVIIHGLLKSEEATASSASMLVAPVAPSFLCNYIIYVIIYSFIESL